jgi:hypothetical protein
VHAAAERAVDQGGGGEEIGVAVALDDAVGEAGDDRRLRDDAAGNAFEADHGLAGGEADAPALADQGEAVQPLDVHGLLAAIRVAVDGDFDLGGAGEVTTG